MVEFPGFIYLDTQKTGSRWVLKTLTEICGKPCRDVSHHVLEEKSDKPTLISIRNPFDQYVSTYSYGGGPRNQWPKIYPLKTGKQSRLSWKQNSPKEFAWFVEESMEMWPNIGLSSQRHFRLALGLKDVYVPDTLGPSGQKYLWTEQTRDLFQGKSVDEMLKFEKEHRHYTHVIAMETLEDDLVSFIEDVQPENLVHDWRQRVKELAVHRVNTSPNRNKDYTHYYDDRLVKLVSESERFLLERFGYRFGKVRV